MEPADAGLVFAPGLRAAAVPALSGGPDQGKGGERSEARPNHVRGNPCSSQGQALWPNLRFTDDADLNRQALEWCDTVTNPRAHGPTAAGHASRGVDPSGPAAGPKQAGPLPPGGPEGGPGRLCPLRGLPLRGAVAKVRGRGADGPAPRHRGDLGRRPPPAGASPTPEGRPAFHPARPVGGSGEPGKRAPPRGGGGADSRGPGGAALPGGVRTGSDGRGL